jgi:hypothetical protein
VAKFGGALAGGGSTGQGRRSQRVAEVGEARWMLVCGSGGWCAQKRG